MMYYYPGAFSFNIFGLIIQILFGVLVIWLIVAVLRSVMGRGGWRGWRDLRRDEAMEILKERYAKGELTKEQFESMKKDIA